MAPPTCPPRGTAEGAAPRWTVAAVAARLGVAPATLRSWSRRYGVGPVDHRAGRYRRFTDTDIAELETMRRLADEGMVLSSAAAMARRHHRGNGTPDPHTVELEQAEPVRDVKVAEVRALAHAAQRLDTDTLLRTLEASLERRGVSSTWNQLCRPGLGALDHPDAATNCVDGALMLARAITTSLHRRYPTVPAVRTQRVLLACAPGEHHTLALDALGAALSEHDVPASVLGPAAPLPALLHTVEHTRPPLVVVWAQRTATARPTPLRRLVPHAVTVAAGPGWSTSRLPSGVQWINSLDDAVHLAREAAGPAPGPVRPAEARASSAALRSRCPAERPV